MKVYVLAADPAVAVTLALVADLGGFDAEACDTSQDFCTALVRDPVSIGLVHLSPLLAASTVLGFRNADVAAPIFALCPEPDHRDRARILFSGADDVQPWPLDRTEVIARLSALARRERDFAELWVKLPGDARFHLERGIVEFTGGGIMLTKQEGTILATLARRPGITVTKEVLYDALYGGLTDQAQPKVIDVFVCKIRKKLFHVLGGVDVIETSWGRGYSFNPDRHRPTFQPERTRPTFRSIDGGRA